MIYLDNAATSWPKPEDVYRAMDDFMRHVGANPGRSGHEPSIEAGRIIYETREAIAQLFGIGDPLRIVFSSGATEALNLVIRGMLRPGEHVITGSMEHNSVMRPLRAMEGDGVEVTTVSCTAAGVLAPHNVEKAIKRNTRLIIINHASNVMGALLPVAEVGEIAHRRDVCFAVDVAQTAGCCPIDIEAMNIDLLAFSGHKGLYGPQGTGGLYIGRGIELEPLIYGGTGSQSESELQPDFLPDRYESGTPNTPGLAGLGAGVRFVLSQGVGGIRSKGEELTRLLVGGLRSIPGVIVFGGGDAKKHVPVLSFNIAGLTPSEVATRLGERDIMCRPGLHCAPIAHRTMGTFPQGTVRLSPGYFTTEEEIEITLEAVREIALGDKGG